MFMFPALFVCLAMIIIMLIIMDQAANTGILDFFLVTATLFTSLDDVRSSSFDSVWFSKYLVKMSLDCTVVASFTVCRATLR